MLNQNNLEILANIVQLFNYWENLNQTSNDKILQELQKQNEQYLEIILHDLKQIKQELKGNKQNV